MRIAYLSTDPTFAYRGTRGTAVRLGELTAALAREGADVLLVVAGVLPGAPPPPGLTVEVLPGPKRTASTAARLAAEPGRVAWLTNVLRQFGAHVLIEHLALHSSAGSAVARQLGIPHLVELNAPLLDAATASHRLYHPADAERMERDVLAHASLVFAATSPLSAYALGRGARRVDVLPNAADPDRFPRPSDADHDVDHDVDRDARAVFMASMRAWHGIDTIVDAWRQLGDIAPPLTVVGDGPGRVELLASGFDVRRPVPHHEVPELLVEFDIGLAPYVSGAARYLSPLKVFEYLAAGLAVVTSDLPGVTDHLRDDATVLIPLGSADALAEAVALLARNAPLRTRLGTRGPSIIASRHTWAHRAQRVMGAVRDLVPATGATR
jgi:glycosyltransferase involved in cell wall biosynthesis